MNVVAPRFRRVVWSLTALYAIALFIATHLPPSEIPKSRVSDKFVHFVVYLPLGALLCASLCSTGLSAPLAAISALGGAMAFGALDELTQPLVGRVCSLNDWYADALGAACAVIIMAVISKLPRRQSQS